MAKNKPKRDIVEVKKQKTGSKKWLIISLVAVIVVLALVSIYFYFNRSSGRHGFQMRNFQLNESQIAEVTNTFNNAGNISDIQSYCSQNRMSCFYYCRNVNPANSYCSGMMGSYNGTRYPGGRQWSQ